MTKLRIILTVFSLVMGVTTGSPGQQPVADKGTNLLEIRSMTV